MEVEKEPEPEEVKIDTPMETEGEPEVYVESAGKSVSIIKPKLQKIDPIPIDSKKC